jgi:phosphomannomutase/phosphoglucomutase
MTAALDKAYEVITVDGARAVFEHGWGLVRASNTQPAITMRFEAYNKQQLVDYMMRFKTLVEKHPEVDSSPLQEQIVAFSA